MNIRIKEGEVVDKVWNEYGFIGNSVNNEIYEAEGEDDIYTTFVEKDAVEEEELTSYNLTEEELEEIEELMVEALGLDDGPNLESETDLWEWFAEMDEDD
ncbi:MAG: hypothetical protein R6W73_02960 [Candidatus Saliniplasma sp.]